MKKTILAFIAVAALCIPVPAFAEEIASTPADEPAVVQENDAEGAAQGFEQGEAEPEGEAAPEPVAALDVDQEGDGQDALADDVPAADGEQDEIVADAAEMVVEAEDEPAPAPEPAAEMPVEPVTEPAAEPEAEQEPEPAVEAAPAVEAEPAAAPAAAPAPDPEPAPAAALAPQALEAEAEGLAEGIYVIRSMNASRQVLDVTAQSKAAGANVEIWDSNGGGNQKWEVRRAADGTYTLKSVLSGLLLDVSGAAAKNGANVIQWQANGGKNQSWSISAAANGSWSIASALSKNLVLDVSGASKSSGANVIVWAPNGGTNQLWEFVPANPDVAAGDSIQTGYYRLKASDGSVLDIAGQSVSAGGNVELWTSNGGANQVFHLNMENGYVRIQNGATGLFVSSTGPDPVAGSNVTQQWKATGESQLFSVEKRADGSYAFKNAANGLYLNAAAKTGANVASGKGATAFTLEPLTGLLKAGIFQISPAHASDKRLDVTSSSTSAGASVIQWASNSGLNQKWEVVAVDGKANTYTMQSLNSGLYLADAGGNAVQQSGAADASRQWSVVPMGNGYSLRNAGTGKYLDISGRSTGNGANACTWERNGGTNQRFNFTGTAPLSNGTYYMRLAAAPSVVVEVEGQSKAAGANVEGWSINNGSNQKWEFTRNSDGTYSIVNGNSKLALSVSGSNVVQQSGNGAAQKWAVSYNHDGTFTLLSAADRSVALTVGEGLPKSGDNASVSAVASTNAQRVRFESTTVFTSGNAQLDNILNAMVASFGSDGQNSLRNVHNWVAGFSYATMNEYPGGSWTSWSVPYAIEMYNNQRGNCYRYASLVTWFARRLGYDARTISGEVRVAGGWAAHGWTEVYQGGQTLVIDTSQQRHGGGRNFFMVDYDHAPLYYRYV